MGWRFELKYANIVAYLTIPNTVPPRLRVGEVRNFLGSTKGAYRGRKPFISARRSWIARISKFASKALKKIDEDHADNSEFLNPDQLKKLLAGFQSSLGQFNLYGMTIGTGDHAEELDAFALHAAYSSRQHALFLIPDYPCSDETIQMLDPFATVRPILDRFDLWPGVLFWTCTGVSAFISFEKAVTAYYLLMQNFERGLSWINEFLESQSADVSVSKRKHLLHLSDLHFGHTDALINEPLLTAKIKTFAHDIDRIVITGDLLNNPTRRNFLEYRNFRLSLERIAGRKIIYVPGNHDYHFLGNNIMELGRSHKQVAELEWSSLFIDHELECNFFCFDSARDGKFSARGNIKVSQMKSVGGEFETALLRSPELNEYLKIAVVHHHPYPFNPEKETLVQRALALPGEIKEFFVAMAYHKTFLLWCFHREISLILHGHKHLQRDCDAEFRVKSGKHMREEKIPAIGCGTSLGIKNRPTSYNMLRWSPSEKKWNVSFYSDPDGTGFREELLELHTVKVWEL